MRNLYRNPGILPEGLDNIKPKNVSSKIKETFDFVPENRPSARNFLNFYEKFLFNNK